MSMISPVCPDKKTGPDLIAAIALGRIERSIGAGDDFCRAHVIADACAGDS
jgi:hypothetical protein